MCRLFGCRSRAVDAVSHELFHGANALRVQSREHPDGWGVGWYEDGVPRVVRSLTPAHGDADFEKLSHFVSAQTVLAHVRKASVGRVAEDNTHPFQRGPWLFAHNGTIPDWDRVRAPLEALIDPSLRDELRGETDSERCFLLFLSLLRRRCELERANAEADGSALASRLERAHHRRQLRLGAGERLRGREGDHLVPAVPVSEQATVVLEIERLRVTPQVEHRAAGQGLAAQVLELRQTALHLVDHRPLELVLVDPERRLDGFAHDHHVRVEIRAREP